MAKMKDVRETDTHIYFWGSEMSNWYPSIFMYKDQRFNNAEQAFMWEKANFFNDERTAAKILKETNPKYAKRLGRQVSGFNVEDWMINGFIFMVAVNYAKWTSSETLRQLLVATAPKVLVEASPYDKIWGVGLSQDDDRILDEHKWEGLNLLGKALMSVREELIEDEKEG